MPTKERQEPSEIETPSEHRKPDVKREAELEQERSQSFDDEDHLPRDHRGGRYGDGW